jgi:O-antigen/teichoic acid export membrane protein
MSYGVSQFGMLVLIAKLGTAEKVGQFALGLAIATPIIMFTNMHLREVQATDATGAFAFTDYLRLRLVGVSVAVVTVAVFAFGGSHALDTALAILWVGVGRATDAVGDVYHGLLQQHERMDRIGKSGLLKAAACLAALAAGFRMSGGSVAWAAAGVAAASAVVLALYDARAPRMVFGQAAMPAGPAAAAPGGQTRAAWRLARLAWLALPLGVVMALVSLNSSVPRYYVELHLGRRNLGLFAAMAQLMAVGSMLMSALGQSMSSRLARYYARHKRSAFVHLFLRLAGVAVLVGGAGVLVAVLGGRSLLTWLYRPEYGHHADVFTWLMVGGGVSCVAGALGHGMTAARYFAAQVPLFAMTTLVTALACTWLVPEKGLLGGALAVLCGMIVQLVGGAAIVAHALCALPNARRVRISNG